MSPTDTDRILTLVPPSNETSAPEDPDAREAETRALHDRGLPVKHAGAIVADRIVATPALTRVRRWLGEGLPVLLVLSGPFDSGKSFAASWAASQEATDLEKNEGIVVCAELLFDAAGHERGPVKGFSLSDLLSCHVLVIDDIGWEGRTDVQMVGTLVDQILRTRIERGLLTLITTNVPTPVELGARYEVGERLIESITKHGEWYLCEFVGMRRGPHIVGDVHGKIHL